MGDVVSERLKQLREAKTGNQSGVAKAVGMSQTTYSDWENNPPRTLEHLAALARHFSVSADYLLGLTDDPSMAAARTGWDEVTVEIANKVMTLPPHRRVNVQLAVDAIVGREEAIKRAEEAAQLAGLYEEALQAAAMFIAGQKLVGVDLTTLRAQLDGLLGTHGARILQALAEQSDS